LNFAESNSKEIKKKREGGKEKVGNTDSNYCD